nr:hypothetical protein CFP56_04892 [Quercus suber]
MAEKPSETADRQAEKMDRADLGEKGEVDRDPVTIMEIAETEAQSTPQSRNISSPLIEIQDINVALGKFDNCEKHVEHNLASTPQFSANKEKPLPPSMPAHLSIVQELAHHVIEISPPPNSVNRTLRTWKKLALSFLAYCDDYGKGKY